MGGIDKSMTFPSNISVTNMPTLSNGTWAPLLDPADGEEIFTYFSDFERSSKSKYANLPSSI